MRIRGSMVAILISILGVLAGVALAVRVGDAAPDFTGADINGQSHKLSDYKGKFVVLEWHNQGCPYVRKQYNSGNMEKLQKEWTQKGVVWLTIISSAPNTQGYVTADQEKEYLKEKGASPTTVLLDPDGTIGHLYSARTTPHMFIIDPKGTLVYNGAIDDHPTTDVADIPNSRNYVTAALQEAMSGKAVTEPSTRPYGCSVKYKD